MALVLNGSGSITGVTDLATAGVALEDAALTDPVVTGGIYLGGTGAANYLDDYEEGTWTPTVDSNLGGSATTYGQISGKYTKIGNLVICKATFRPANGSYGKAGYGGRLGGMPFTPSATGSGSLINESNITFGGNVAVSTSYTRMYLYMTAQSPNDQQIVCVVSYFTS